MLTAIIPTLRTLKVTQRFAFAKVCDLCDAFFFAEEIALYCVSVHASL